MKITTQLTAEVRDDWESCYQISLDDKVTKKVNIFIPAKPSTVKIAATNPINFTLWSGAAYDEANALNDGKGYGNSDLVSAIGSFLTNHLADN